MYRHPAICPPMPEPWGVGGANTGTAECARVSLWTGLIKTNVGDKSLSQNV